MHFLYKAPSHAYGHSLVPQLYKETFIHRKTTNQKCLTQGANKPTERTLVYNVTTEREKQKIALFSSRGGCAYELTLLFEFPVPVSNDEATPSINVGGGVTNKFLASVCELKNKI